MKSMKSAQSFTAIGSDWLRSAALMHGTVLPNHKALTLNCLEKAEGALQKALELIEECKKEMEEPYKENDDEV